jgi:AraC family transcriptional regulator
VSVQKTTDSDFYGARLGSREVADFLLTEMAYEPATYIPEHSHSHAYFCLVRRGRFSERCGNKVRSCPSSTLIFHSLSEEHSNRFDDVGGSCLNIQLKPTWLQRWQEADLLPRGTAYFPSGTLSQLAVRLYREFCSSDKSSAVLIEGLVLELIGETCRHNDRAGTHPPRWAEQARTVIHDTFSDSLSVSTIAELVGVHPVHLARIFRRHYQCSVGEYIRRVRVEAAMRELSATNTSVATIAAHTGFSDQSHFCKTFKRLTGQTPIESRIAARLG